MWFRLKKHQHPDHGWSPWEEFVDERFTTVPGFLYQFTDREPFVPFKPGLFRYLNNPAVVSPGTGQTVQWFTEEPGDARWVRVE